MFDHAFPIESLLRIVVALLSGAVMVAYYLDSNPNQTLTLSRLSDVIAVDCPLIALHGQQRPREAHIC